MRQSLVGQATLSAQLARDDAPGGWLSQAISGPGFGDRGAMAWRKSRWPQGPCLEDCIGNQRLHRSRPLPGSLSPLRGMYVEQSHRFLGLQPGDGQGTIFR
jgi:hypothetical protein